MAGRADRLFCQSQAGPSADFGRPYRRAWFLTRLMHSIDFQAVVGSNREFSIMKGTLHPPRRTRAYQMAVGA